MQSPGLNNYAGGIASGYKNSLRTRQNWRRMPTNVGLEGLR